jgi:hypothetical protein
MRKKENENTKRLEELGFGMKILGGPRAVLEKDTSAPPMIRFKIELLWKGETVLKTKYSLGVGYLKKPKAEGRTPFYLSADDEPYYYSWARQRMGGYPKYYEPEKALPMVTKMAVHQHVKPEMDDVVASLMRDGEACFLCQTFGDWCDCYGVDTDSRRMRRIYRKCIKIGMRMKRIPNGALAETVRILGDELGHLEDVFK